MKISRLALLLVVLVARVPAARAEPDAKAVAVGKAMWEALGGDAGWQKARYFRFDFVVEKGGKPVATRAHYWDRYTGRYRVDGEEKGKPWRVYLNVNDKTGVAFVDGKKVTDAAQTKKWLEDAYGAFINDSYWLLAPYKIFDPGVSLSYAGEDKGPAGETCDVLKLSFGNVGLTPKDVYWQMVDRKTHLLAAWKFVLEGQEAKGKKEPSLFAWREWKEVGPIRLAMAREGTAKGGIAIRFDKVAVAGDVDEAALAVPAQ
jgi:hypothetical protein